MVDVTLSKTNSASGIPQPLLSYTRSMVEPAGDWKLVGDYAIWSGNRAAAEEPYVLLQEKDHKVLPVPISSARAILHPIKGGTWFHVERLFGFWMKADVDSVWIDAPGENAATHYHTLLVGGAEGRPGTLASGWLCPNCGEVFNQTSVDVTRRRFQTFLDRTAEQVAAFNANSSKRVCPSCKSEHPPTYGFTRPGSR
jgi:transposase-like protein